MTAIFEGSHAVEYLAVVLSVADYKRPDLQRQPSLPYLAWNAGMPAERFEQLLGELESKGLVKRTGSSEEVAVDLQPLEQLIETFTADEQL